MDRETADTLRTFASTINELITVKENHESAHVKAASAIESMCTAVNLMSGTVANQTQVINTQAARIVQLEKIQTRILSSLVLIAIWIYVGLNY